MAIDYINTLGAGAGFNTKEIVEALVQAERVPAESRLESKIADTDAQVSALGLAVSSLQTIEATAKDLKDRTDFNTVSISNSQTTALSVTSDANASVGSHSITINSVAKEQRTNLSPHGLSEFSASSQLLNSGTAFDLAIEIGDTSTVSHTVSVTTTTPQGIVDAVNAADLDVTAQLIDKGTSGSNYIVQLVGKSGTDNQFTITPSVGSLLASDTPSGFSAANASLTVNGVAYTRSSNNINNIIEGLTLDLNGPTTGTASVSVTQDRSDIETKILSLVEAYNTAKTAIAELTDRELDGALSGDSVFKQTFRSVTNLFLNTSSTPGDSIKSLSDMGISINKQGILEVSDTKLASALTSNFDDIKNLFSANTEDQTNIGVANRGLAGDLTKLIDDLTSSSGYLSTRADQLEDNKSQYLLDLEALDEKMARLTERYERQFASMNTLIDQLNNTKDNLVSSLENLPFTNKN